MVAAEYLAFLRLFLIIQPFERLWMGADRLDKGRPLLVLVHGYGFPRWRGGPMHYAERLGLSGFLSRIETLAAADPVSWRVPDLLRRAISEGKTLEELSGRMK